MTNAIRNTDYKPPYPYFGGKSAVADMVWDAIGADVMNYVEPFAGSAADGKHQEFVIDMAGIEHDRERAEFFERNLQRAIERLVENERGA